MLPLEQFRQALHPAPRDFPRDSGINDLPPGESRQYSRIALSPACPGASSEAVTEGQDRFTLSQFWQAGGIVAGR